MESSLPILCDDLMIEILSWLPVKSLLRFKCVSKSFHSLISNSDFVKLHLQRSPKNVNMISWSSTVTSKGVFRGSYSMALLDNNTSSIIPGDQYHRMELMAQEKPLLSCIGLICFVRKDHSRTYRVRLWNPATGLTSQEWPCLEPYYLISVFGFGYDVFSDTYKVVAVFYNSTETHVKVCGLGDNCWRSIESFPALPNLRQDGVNLSSTLNWLGDPNFDSFSNINQMVIVSLDLSKETFRQLLLPLTLVGVSSLWQSLAVLNDCLCFVHDCNETHLVVWQMKEYGDVNSWVRLFKLSYQRLQINRPESLCMFEDDGILIVKNRITRQAVFYDRRDNSVQHIKVPYNVHCIYAKDYVPSLVSPY